MVSDSVLSSSGVDMTATRELAEERTNHRCHVDARAVGAHGVGLKRSSACLNPQNPTGPYRALLKRHRAVRYSTHTSAAFGRSRDTFPLLRLRRGVHVVRYRTVRGRAARCVIKTPRYNVRVGAVTARRLGGTTVIDYGTSPPTRSLSYTFSLSLTTFTLTT